MEKKNIKQPHAEIIIRKVKGDGNCFFYSLAHQILKTENDTHIETKGKSLRQQIVDYLEENIEQTGIWLDTAPENWLQYLATIRKDKQLVSSECIAAAVQVLRKDIWVYQENCPVIKFTRGQEENLSANHIKLYYEAIHYDSVIAIKEHIENENNSSNRKKKEPYIQLGKIDDNDVVQNKEKTRPVELITDTWIRIEQENLMVYVDKMMPRNDLNLVLWYNIEQLKVNKWKSRQEMEEEIEFKGENGKEKEIIRILNEVTEAIGRRIIIFSSNGEKTIIKPKAKSNESSIIVYEDIVTNTIGGITKTKKIKEKEQITTGQGMTERIIKIPHNQDCLFAAISHQISGIHPSNAEFKELPKALREDVNKYLIKKGKAPMNENSIGNMETIKAIANITNWTIQIWKNEGNCIVIEPETAIPENRNCNIKECEINDTIHYDSFPSKINTIEKHKEKATEQNKESQEQNTKETGEKLVKIASLNVRGCCTLNKREEIDDCLNSYHIAVAVLQEVNLIASSASTKFYDWHISNRNEANKTRGLAILIHKAYKLKIRDIRTIDTNILSAIIGWEGIGSEFMITTVHAPNTRSNCFFTRLEHI